MDDLCRICRTSCLNTSISLSCEHNGVPLKEMLIKTCPIDINFDDPVSQLLPQSICTDCLKTVSEAYNLQQVCLESDQYFRSMVAGGIVNVKTEKIEDEIGVKVEEVQMEIENFEMKMEVDEEPLSKRRKKQVVVYYSDTSETKFRPSRSKKQDENDEFHPRQIAIPQSNQKWFVCNFCDIKTKQKRPLLRHMQMHSPNLHPFACEFCIERFVDENGLNQHGSSAHSGSEPRSTLFCDLCGVTGDKRDGMEHHMLDDHLRLPSDSKTTKSYKCSTCGSKFAQYLGYSIHVITEHGQKAKCEKCDAEFSDKNELNSHIMMVHEKLFRQLEQKDIVVSLKCCKCELDHSTQNQLLDHLNVHKTSFPAEKTKCNFCRTVVGNFKEFLEHSKYHARPQTHECLACKKLFPFDEKFVRHVKNHKRYDGGKVQCRKCKQMLRSAKDLELHDKVKHHRETLFMCPICAKALCSANVLNQHIRYVHNKDQEKKLKCKFCPMEFVRKSKLIRHEAVHSTARPHICEICGSSFKHNDGLALHMKRHNGTLVRKHECTHCGFKFATKNRLVKHLMTHTGQKPHECKYCDRAYASKDNLIKHMQKNHIGDAVYQCEQCPKAFRLIVELREHQIEHGS